MAEIKSLQDSSEELFPQELGSSPMPQDSADSGIANKISEMSKKGYSFLKVIVQVSKTNECISIIIFHFKNLKIKLL